METDKKENLLHKLILYFSARSKGHVTKFQMIKMLYLLDLYMVKWTGAQLTELDWTLYHHGPYADDIENAINIMVAAGTLRLEPISNNQGYNLVAVEPRRDVQLEPMVAFMLENVRKKCTSLSHDELYSFVYNTEPMRRQDISPEAKAMKQPLDLMLERENMLAGLDAED